MAVEAVIGAVGEELVERQLLFSVGRKDLKVDYFRAGGKGGQHQNKTSSACRIVHIDSGAVGESRSFREQGQNRKAAFLRMANSEVFKKWHKLECARRMGMEAEIERVVEQQMRPQNLMIEVHDESGRTWVECDQL